MTLTPLALWGQSAKGATRGWGIREGGEHRQCCCLQQGRACPGTPTPPLGAAVAPVMGMAGCRGRHRGPHIARIQGPSRIPSLAQLPVNSPHCTCPPDPLTPALTVAPEPSPGGRGPPVRWLAGLFGQVGRGHSLGSVRSLGKGGAAQRQERGRGRGQWLGVAGAWPEHLGRWLGVAGAGRAVARPLGLRLGAGSDAGLLPQALDFGDASGPGALSPEKAAAAPPCLKLDFRFRRASQAVVRCVWLHFLPVKMHLLLLLNSKKVALFKSRL